MVYFILDESNKRVKIGITKNGDSLKRRLAELQVGNSHGLKIIAAVVTRDKRDEYLERMLHAEFNRYHIRGEWFIFSDEIETFSKEVSHGIREYNSITIQPTIIHYFVTNSRYDTTNNRLDMTMQYCLKRSEQLNT